MSRTYVRWPGNHTLEPPIISFESNTSKWEGLSTFAPSFLRSRSFPVQPSGTVTLSPVSTSLCSIVALDNTPAWLLHSVLVL